MRPGVFLLTAQSLIWGAADKDAIIVNDNPTYETALQIE